MKQEKIRGITLSITTFCNRNCPYCCCGIPKAEGKTHYDISYFERLIPYFKNMKEIFITGGEPTLHPNFYEVTNYIKKYLKPRKYSLATNGYGLNKLPLKHFLHFNKIHISEYDNPSNNEETEQFKKIAPDSLFRIVNGINHIKKASGENPCKRASSGWLAFENNLLYPCCVVVDRGIGIELSDDWREKILDVSLPCNICVFGK